MNAARKLDQIDFSNKSQEIQAHIKLGEDFGDQKRIEAANGLRAGIIALGRSESSIGHISESESKHSNGQTTVASYNPNNLETKLIGIDSLIQISESIGQSVRDTVEQALNHENKHEEAHHAEGSEEFNVVISYLFGNEAIEDVEEAAASLGTTEKWDGYKDKRVRALGHAQKLGLSLIELSDIKLKGDYEGLIEIAANSHLLNNQEPANS